MSSLTPENIILTKPNPAGYGPLPTIIAIDEGRFVDVVITGSINGEPIGPGPGFPWLTADGPATLNNKDLVDATNRWVDATGTRSLTFDLAGAGSTVVRLDSTAARVIVVPDSATDAEVLLDAAPAHITAEHTYAAPPRFETAGIVGDIESADGGVVTLRVSPTAVDTVMTLPASGAIVTTANVEPWTELQRLDEGWSMPHARVIPIHVVTAGGGAIYPITGFVVGEIYVAEVRLMARSGAAGVMYRWSQMISGFADGHAPFDEWVIPFSGGAINVETPVISTDDVFINLHLDGIDPATWTGFVILTVTG